MGKVLKSFTNGFPGTISRALDDVVVALGNKSGAALDFGVPVALSSDGSGVVPFNPASHTAANFVGVTVRLPSKTPDTFGSNQGSYAANDLCDILVRGHIVVDLDSDTAKMGDAVSILKSDGSFTVGSGETVVALNNVRVSAVPDTSGRAEILLTERNIL